MANGTLEILLVEAKGIKDRDRRLLGCLNCVCNCNNTRKPYAHIVFGDQERTSKVGKGKGKNREWNEKFTFDVKFPDGAEDHVYKIIIRLMDKHKFSDDDFVGEATVYVKDILSLGVEKGKVEVEPRQYRVVESDKTYSGEISVAIAFIKGKDGTEEDTGGWKESSAQERNLPLSNQN